MKGCEAAGDVVICGGDGDIMFDVEGLFDVELCTEHARKLRDAIFFDENITEAIEAHRLAVDTRLSVLNAPPQPSSMSLLISTERQVTNARRAIYKAVMEWLKKERTP